MKVDAAELFAANIKAAGLHVEVDKELQVLFVVRDGQITQISPVSTAGLPGRFTPSAQFAVYRKVDGFDRSPLGTLYTELLHRRLRDPRQPVGAALPGVARVRARADVDRADDVHRVVDRHARRRLLAVVSSGSSFGSRLALFRAVPRPR